MSKLYDLQELVDHTGLPERTVRYYLAKVLEAPGGTRGRKAFYPQLTLDQLKLAQQILMAPYDAKRGEVKPSLRDFKRWLKSQTAEEIHQMAEMPYRIKPKVLLAASAPQEVRLEAPQEAPHEAPQEEMDMDQGPAAFMQDFSEENAHSKHKEYHVKESTDSASQYLSRVMGTNQGTASVSAKQAAPWQKFRFGDDLVIKTRTPLSPTQKQQLTLAGQLLQSMLKKENK